MTDDKPLLSPKEVAKHLDRRQVRRKLALWGALAAAIVLAVTYLTCGRGWGVGGAGEGKGEGGKGSAKGLVDTVDAAVGRCAIFLAPEGITVDGARMTREEAVAACKATAGADVIVAGDTRRGDWDDLKAALDAAGIEVFRREPTGAPADAGP